MKNTQLLAAFASTLAALTISGAAMAQSTTLTQLYPALVSVELQASQQESLERISQQALAELRRSLSPAQVNKFDLAIGQGKSVRATLATLNLSTAQQHSLQQKLRLIRSQLTSILTLEQQQKVAQNAISMQRQMNASK